jgi:hypothetical protein
LGLATRNKKPDYRLNGKKETCNLIELCQPRRI